MKTIYLNILFLFFTALALANVHADGNIIIRLHQPPPNTFSLKDLWKLDITNTTQENINIYLSGTATESVKGLIVSGKSNVISIGPGTKTYTYEDYFKSGDVNWNDKSLKEILFRTGIVPEGEYKICITPFYENNEIADQESCIEQIINQSGSIMLVSPTDDVLLDPEALTGLTFSWTPLQGAKDYTIKIVEIKGKQSKEAAMNSNRAFFEKKGIKLSSFKYPTNAQKFEPGKKFAWLVSETKILNNDIIISEINSFQFLSKPGLNCNATACFTIPDTAICLNDIIVINGSCSQNETNYFLSIQESDMWWNRYGIEQMEWFSGAAPGSIDIKTWYQNKGSTWVCGKYYRVRVAVKNACTEWDSFTKLIYIKCCAYDCPKFKASPYSIKCNYFPHSNNYTFQLTVTNLESTVGNVYLTTSGMTLNNFSPTIANPNSSTIISGNVSGSGTTLCINVSFSVIKGQSCDTTICFTLPLCTTNPNTIQLNSIDTSIIHFIDNTNIHFIDTSQIGIVDTILIAHTGPDCGGKISGTVYADLNNNGIMDGSDYGIPNIPVKLTGPVSTSYGSVLSSPVFPSITGAWAGRGMAFDGQNIYSTFMESNLGQGACYKFTTGGTFVSAISNSSIPGNLKAKPLSWDFDHQYMWTGGYGTSPGDIFAFDINSGLEIANTRFSVLAAMQNYLSGINALDNFIGHLDGLQYDSRDQSIWCSNDRGNFVYHFRLNGTFLGAFRIPYNNNSYSNTGIAFDGNNLWLVLISEAIGGGPFRIVKVDNTGSPLTYFEGPHNDTPEDIEFDCITFADDMAIWANQAVQLGATPIIKAYSIGGSGVLSTVTDNNGKYTLINIPQGNYTLIETPPLGWSPANPSNAQYSISILPSQSIGNLDFGNTP